MIAHPGGTPVALLAAYGQPQLYWDYIAMAQIKKQNESERIAYNCILEQYTKTGNQRAINELKKYQVKESGSSIISFYKSSFATNIWMN